MTNGKSGLEKMVEWLEEGDKHIMTSDENDMLHACLIQAQSLLAEEYVQKPSPVYLQEHKKLWAMAIKEQKKLAECVKVLEKSLQEKFRIIQRLTCEQTESLAELADRKGFDISAIGHWGTWVIEIWNHKHEGLRHNNNGETYAEAESKARAYLMGLEEII